MRTAFSILTWPSGEVMPLKVAAVHRPDGPLAPALGHFEPSGILPTEPVCPRLGAGHRESTRSATSVKLFIERQLEKRRLSFLLLLDVARLRIIYEREQRVSFRDDELLCLDGERLEVMKLKVINLQTHTRTARLH